MQREGGLDTPTKFGMIFLSSPWFCRRQFLSEPVEQRRNQQLCSIVRGNGRSHIQIVTDLVPQPRRTNCVTFPVLLCRRRLQLIPDLLHRNLNSICSITTSLFCNFIHHRNFPTGGNLAVCQYSSFHR
jgi:hypothetical protein